MDALPDLRELTRKRIVVLGAGLAAAVLAAVLAWLAIGAWARERMNLLPIREVVFAGELTRVDADDLKRIAAGLRTVGASMLHTDLNQVRAAVMQVEWVREASVRRRFPATLVVDVEEHVPFARWTSVDGEARLVNRHGEVFEAEVPDEEAWPALGGPDDQALAVANRYLAFKDALAPTGQALAGLTLSSRRAWRATLTSGAVIELGREEPDARLARLVRAWPQLPALAAATRIDLRYASGMAVRAPASTPPPPNTRSKAPGKA